MRIFFAGFIFVLGLLLGGGLIWHWTDSRYAKLRAEVIAETGVDITYPYKDGRINKGWFNGKP